MHLFWVSALAVLIAYTVKGLTGFANTLVFSTIMSFFPYNLAQITPLELVLGTPSNFFIAIRERKGFRLRVVAPLAVLMIALGVVILLNPFQSAQVLITFIGICMLADGVINLFNAFVVWQHLRALKKVAAAAVNAVASAAGATADVVVDAVSTDDIPEEPAPDSVPEPAANSVPEPAAEDEKKPEE